MDYTLLTDDHKRQMWQQLIGQLEERHYALTMDYQLALALHDMTDDERHEVQQRVDGLARQIALIEQQHAAAIANLAPAEEITP